MTISHPLQIEAVAAHVKTEADVPPDAMDQITPDSVLEALDFDRDGKVTLEEYLMDGMQDGDDEGIDDLDDVDFSIDSLTGGDDPEIE